MKRAIIINLFGGPGSGKSTGASYIFSQLKMRGVNAELVTEYAKDKVWEDNKTALSNQAYMFGKQYYKISRCEDKVDVIITDSPILLSVIYNQDSRLGSSFSETVLGVFNSYDNMNYFISRVKPYNPIGRLQTEHESDGLSLKISAMLASNHIPYTRVDGNVDGYDSIVDNIMNKLNSDTNKA